MNVKTKKRKPTTDAVEILHRRYFEGKPEMLAMLEEARVEEDVARKIYALRTRWVFRNVSLPSSLALPPPPFAAWKMPTMKVTQWPCLSALRRR